MKHATPEYVHLMLEMGEWYRAWKNAAVCADAEYVDFVRAEYEVTKQKLTEMEARLSLVR